MSISRALFSSENDEWRTPPELFALLDAEFRFDLDAAATAENALCRMFLTSKENGLTSAWYRHGRRAFCNPPYSSVDRWMRKAVSEAQRITVVAVVPARLDTAWWHASAMKAAEWRIPKGRVCFVGPGTRAPFPTAIVVFRPGHSGPPQVKPLAWRDIREGQATLDLEEGAA